MAPPTISSTNSRPAPRSERLDDQGHDGELAVPAALLLEPALGLSGDGDRLPVGDADLVGGDRHPELPGQALEGDGEVQVALAAELGLVDLVVATDHQRRVVLDQAVQRVGELVLVGGVDGRDRDPVHGLRRRAGPGPHRGALGGEGVAGGGGGELGHRGDVAGRRPRSTSTCSRPRSVNKRVEPLVGAGAGVHQVVVGSDGARQHPEHRDLADERVGGGAEDLERGRARRDRASTAAVPSPALHLDGRSVER